MKELLVTAKISAKEATETTKAVVAATATIPVNVPETVNECLEVYGEEACHSNLVAQIKIAIQSTIRRGLTAGKDVETMTTELSTWKLGVSQRKAADPMSKVLKATENMDAAQLAAMIKTLKGQLNG